MLKRIIETLLIALAYYLSGKLGQTMAIPPGNVTPVWPPSGIALALMLLMGSNRVIPGLFIGAFSANLNFFDGAATSTALFKAFGTGTGIAIGSILQPLLGVYLIKRFVDNADPFYRIKNFLTLVAIIPLMCLVSASFGTTSLTSGGFAPWAAYTDIWVTWWLGDSVGVLVAAPLLLAWWHNWRFNITPLAIAETSAIFAGLLAASWAAFANQANTPLAFLPVPFLLWAALRLDLRGATTAILAVEAIAIINTLQNQGPFYSPNLNESLLLLQLFIGVFTTTIVIVAIFVKERNRAQKALLEEHQNQLGNLAETLSGKYFYYRHNPQGVFTYASASVEQIAGYTPEEFKQYFEEFLPDTPRNQVAVAYTNGSIRGEQQPVYEIDLLHKDGSTRRMEIFERPVLDEDGTVVAVEGMACDITNRIAEAERFSSLLESAPDGMIIVNEHGEITLINARIEELFGYGRDELIGESIEKLVPQDQRSNHVALRDAFAEETKINHMNIGNEVMGLKSDGSQFPVEVNLGTIKIDDGILISASVRDITERQREEERFRTVFNTSRDAYFFQNELGFIDCNESTVRMFGYDDKSEIIGLSPAEVSPEFQPDGAPSEERAKEATAIAREKGYYRFEWTSKKRNGDLLPLEVTLTPVALDNQPVIFAVAHDLTERKKAEQALREGEEYKSAILESSLDCLISMDHEGKVIEFNPASEKTFGYKRDEVIGRSLSEMVVPPALREAHEEGLKHYLNTGEGPVLNQRIEISAMRSDGTEFPIELTITPFSRGDTPVFTAFVRDITERKEAEEALAQSENRLNLAMETSGVGLWDFNSQTGDTYLSKEYLSMLGYAHHELPHGYDTWQKLLHSDDRKRATGHFNLFITSGAGNEIYEDEYRMLTKAGEERWILARGGVVARDEDNTPVRIIGTHVDITERKASEEQLARQELEARLLHRATQIASETDVFEDSLQQCLDIVCELTGWPIGHVYMPAKDGREELDSTTIWYIENSEKHSEFRAITERTPFVKGSGLPGRIWESGEPAWIVDVQKDPNFPRNKLSSDLGVRGAFGFPIKIGGEIVAVLEFFAEQEMLPDEQLLQTIRGMGTQISLVLERRRSQDTLAHLVDQQNAALEINRAVQRIRVPDDLQDVLRTCNEQLRKLNFNFRSLSIHRLMDAEERRFETHALLDSDRFERLNRRLAGIYDMWQEGQPVYRKNQKMLLEFLSENVLNNLSERHGYSIKSILEVPHARGTFSLIGDCETPFGDEDIRFAQTVADTISLGLTRIDDLEQLEARNVEMIAARDEAQRAAREAEAANQAKSVFLANMSHEIRTPMNAILGFSQILDGVVHEPQQKEYLSSIQSSGKSLLTLINDILDLSKVEAGKLELEFFPVDARAVFNDMSQVFSQKVQEKDLDFTVEVDPQLPDILILDEARLRQVLINIIGNAVKFTDQGHVKLSVNFEPANGNHVNLAIDVEDTGIGIPEDQQNKIFGSFAQREGQSINEYGGTGLGLSITKQLVDLMNGQIVVSSQVGVGSVFRVRLNHVEIAPADAEVAQASPLVDVDRISFSPATILITDDIATNRDLIQGYLQPYGFTLIEAEDGQQAIAAIRQNRPDITLMDIKMPVLDGFTATKMIRADGEISERIIVALTASVMRESEEEISQICDGFIRKPVDKETLVAELARHLDHTFDADLESGVQPSELSAILELSPDAFAQLPGLIKQLENRQADCEALSQTLTINDIEVFAQEMKTLGEANGYPPLSQWANQLVLQATTFDMDGMTKTLEDYPAVIAEARAFAEKDAPPGHNAATDFVELHEALEAQKSTWQSISQTLTINEIEAFAARMQELSKTYHYYPLTEWSDQLALQSSTFDMDGMTKTLESYPILLEQIRAQIKS